MNNYYQDHHQYPNRQRDSYMFKIRQPLNEKEYNQRINKNYYDDHQSSPIKSQFNNTFGLKNRNKSFQNQYPKNDYTMQQLKKQHKNKYYQNQMHQNQNINHGRSLSQCNIYPNKNNKDSYDYKCNQVAQYPSFGIECRSTSKQVSTLYKNQYDYCDNISNLNKTKNDIDQRLSILNQHPSKTKAKRNQNIKEIDYQRLKNINQINLKIKNILKTLEKQQIYVDNQNQANDSFYQQQKRYKRKIDNHYRYQQQTIQHKYKEEPTSYYYYQDQSAMIKSYESIQKQSPKKVYNQKIKLSPQKYRQQLLSFGQSQVRNYNKNDYSNKNLIQKDDRFNLNNNKPHYLPKNNYYGQSSRHSEILLDRKQSLRQNLMQFPSLNASQKQLKIAQNNQKFQNLIKRQAKQTISPRDFNLTNRIKQIDRRINGFEGCSSRQKLTTNPIQKNYQPYQNTQHQKIISKRLESTKKYQQCKQQLPMSTHKLKNHSQVCQPSKTFADLQFQTRFSRLQEKKKQMKDFVKKSTQKRNLSTSAHILNKFQGQISRRSVVVKGRNIDDQISKIQQKMQSYQKIKDSLTKQSNQLQTERSQNKRSHQNQKNISKINSCRKDLTKLEETHSNLLGKSDRFQKINNQNTIVKLKKSIIWEHKINSLQNYLQKQIIKQNTIKTAILPQKGIQTNNSKTILSIKTENSTTCELNSNTAKYIQNQITTPKVLRNLRTKQSDCKSKIKKSQKKGFRSQFINDLHQQNKILQKKKIQQNQNQSTQRNNQNKIILINLLKVIQKQIQFDEVFRNQKKYFKQSVCKDKYSILLKQYQDVYKNQKPILLSDINQIFNLTQQQLNPFFQQSKKKLIIKNLIHSYIQCQNHWKQLINVFQNIKIQQFLQVGFNQQNIDSQKKGFICIQDFSTFINMRINTCFNNRDLILIWRRLGHRTQLKQNQRQKLTFYQLLNGLRS